MTATSDWRAAIERQREQREEFLGSHPRSPLGPDERESFGGLSYYPVDPEYRFHVDLDEHEHTGTVTVETSTGEKREYLRWGEFVVEIGGDSVAIQAYKSEPDTPGLWIPFRDATSGTETYGAGRYIDLEPDHHRTDDGKWVLDFNEAYNPTCAYTEGYSCPLPPSENWLEVRIEAGERGFADH